MSKHTDSHKLHFFLCGKVNSTKQKRTTRLLPAFYLEKISDIRHEQVKDESGT